MIQPITYSCLQLLVYSSFSKFVKNFARICNRIMQPQNNSKKQKTKIIFMALVLSVDSRGQDGTLIEFRYLNSKSGFWPFQLHIFAPLGSTRSFCQLVHHINKVNLQFSKKVEKRVTYISDFFQLFYVKSDMLRLYTSNTIPNNSLRPLFFDFMIFILSPLSAILTQNGTNEVTLIG